MKDKLIEEMAQAIRGAGLRDPVDGHEYIEGSEIIAEAALIALCKNLRAQETWETYKQLLEIGRDG